jgi:ATP-dependent RNA helicase DeaD
MTDTQPTFESLKIGDALLRAVREAGYTAPTAVQIAAFVPIAEGRDVIVQSKTGSGKTASFVLPIVDKLLRPDAVVQVIALCPTRELAIQVAGEFERLGKYSDAPVVAIYGGAPIERQVQQIRAGAKIVVGTPGRVLDHLRRGTLNAKTVRVVVLDEGDEMLSMGFAEELNAILEHIPKTRQGVILSATMPESMRRIASRHLREPEHLALSSDGIAPEGITHCVYFSSTGSRPLDVARVLEVERPEAALVFCNTKSETEAVTQALKSRGLLAEFIHGDLAQSDRERVLGLLRDGRVQFLVATDVAARGIDVPHLTHVVNVGLPESAESYVHRTGRTGRAGRAGTAITLAGPKDIGALYFLRLTYGIRPIERSLPSAGDERTQRESDRLQMLIQAFVDGPAPDEALLLARRLLTHDDSERIVASLLAHFFDIERRDRVGRTLSPAHATPSPAPVETPRTHTTVPTATPSESASATQAAPRRNDPRPSRRIDVRHAPASAVTDFEDGGEQGMEELKIAVGKRDNLRAGDVVRFLVDTLKINKRDVGRVHMRDRFTLVAIRSEHMTAALENLKEATYNDRPLAPERGKGAPSTEA